MNNDTDENTNLPEAGGKNAVSALSGSVDTVTNVSGAANAYAEDGGDCSANAAENSEIKKTSKKAEFWRVVKFTLFSISAGIIQISVFTLLQEVFGVKNFWAAHLPALVLSVLWNFTLNREYTFKSATNVPIAMLKVLGYYIVFTPISTLGGDAITEALIGAGMGNFASYLTEGGMMLLNFITEYLFCTFVVYRNSIDSKKKRNNKTKEE